MKEKMEQLIQSGASLQRETDPEACRGFEQFTLRLVARSSEDQLIRPVTPWFHSEEELEGFLRTSMAA